jgi:hypothetical protein
MITKKKNRNEKEQEQEEEKEEEKMFPIHNNMSDSHSQGFIIFFYRLPLRNYTVVLN